MFQQNPAKRQQPRAQFAQPKLRIALYSHDTQGLGHIRRNLAIAGALADGLDDPAILLLSGTHIAGSFQLPPGSDCLTLPALGKNQEGNYAARLLGVALPELIHLRSSLLKSALTSFRPDLLIVDKVPYGALNELKPALQALRKIGRTRCVLGLRDILDDPTTTQREWIESHSDEAIRHYYDALWVYGDPTVYNLAAEYGLAADIAAKIRYTGYLDRFQGASDATPEAAAQLHSLIGNQQLALCAVGGGQDGYPIAYAFAQATMPMDTVGVVMAGPFMPDAQRSTLHQIAAQRDTLQVIDFLADPTALLHRAAAVVAMAGYNSTCEILATQKRALLVPRVKPRLEQWIRAERLNQLGLLDLVHPAQLTPDHIADWLAQHQRQRPTKRPAVDLNGLARLPHLVAELMMPPPSQICSVPFVQKENSHAPHALNQWRNSKHFTTHRLHSKDVPALL
jgi:predicted glycosyltransferase